MCGAVVENQMDHGDAATERTLKEHLQECLEIDKLLIRSRLGKGQPTGHHQGAEELQGPHLLLPVGDLHHLAGAGGGLAGRGQGCLCETTAARESLGRKARSIDADNNY